MHRWVIYHVYMYNVAGVLLSKGVGDLEWGWGGDGAVAYLGYFSGGAKVRSQD